MPKEKQRERKETKNRKIYQKMINSKNYNNKNRLYSNNYINYCEYRRFPAFTLLKIWHSGEKDILIKMLETFAYT